MKKLLFLITLILLGFTIPQRIKANVETPKADVLDVVFNNDGSAIDVSPMGNAIEKIGDIVVTHDSKYGFNMPGLVNPIGGTGTCYYKVDYSGNQAFKDALADGHTLETLVMLDYSGSIGSAEVKPFSSHQNGGTGLMLSGDNKISFLPHVDGDYRWVKSDIIPAPMIFYHIVGVWNKVEGKGYLYVNGKLKATVSEDLDGDFKFPDEGSNWFGIGADPAGAGSASAWNGKVGIARIYDAPLTAEQVQALWKKVDVGIDYAQYLKNDLDSIDALHYVHEVGDSPGQYTQENYNRYNTVYENARAAANEAIESNNVTASNYPTLKANLLNALAELHKNINPVRDGYYYIVNGFVGFKTKQAVEKAMYAAVNNMLAWRTYDPAKPDIFQIFKFTAISDTTYSIQNAATGAYIGSIGKESVQLPMTNTQQVGQMIRQTYCGTIALNNIDFASDYHSAGHKEGDGVEGTIVTWKVGSLSNPCSTWKLYPITDETLINKALTEGPKQKAKMLIESAVAAAKKYHTLVYDYPALITNATDGDLKCQISSNAKCAVEGTIVNLIDGSFNTHFSSDWTADAPAGYHNLQVDMERPQLSIYFSYLPRNSSDCPDYPTNMDIYVTNDETLGHNAASDNAGWTFVGNINEGFPPSYTERYFSPEVKFDQPYRYIRFVVKATHSGRLNSTTSYPFFTISEFQVYNITSKENCEYNKVEGMKAAYDNLTALIAEYETKLADNTFAVSDTTAIYKAMRDVKALWVNRDVIDSKFKKVLAEANKAYNDALPSYLSLITNASDNDPHCQFSSNAKETKEGSYANLLDGDPNTFFHSSWSQEGPDSPHNLQVDLQSNPVKNFFFTFTSRGANYHDTPNNIVIMATNDDAAGADATSQDSKWTNITTIDEPDMPNINAYKYTSKMINMDHTYRYIRFLMVTTTDQANGRVNSISGIPYFNLGEFQMYTGMDPERVQYNYNADVRSAANELKVLLDKYNAYGLHEAWHYDIDILQAGLDKLLSSYADSTELVNLYRKMTSYAANSYVGDEIGTFKEQATIDAFVNEIKGARNTVDLKQPTKISIEAAVKSIKASFDKLMENMQKLVPGQWYNIVSKSNLTYCANKAMYLNYTNTGSQVSFGQYNADTHEATYGDDAYAIWRFVPIEGTDYYGIQNLGTSHFFGPSLGRGSDYPNKLQSHPSPFRVDYIGKGQIQFVSINTYYTEGDQLHAQEVGSVIVPYPTGYDGASCWGLTPVSSDQILRILMMPNSIRIMTLPFDIPAGESSLMNVNGELKTYSLKNLTVNPETGETTLELTLKEDIKAGVPFVVEYGNYSNYDASAQISRIYIPLPETVDTMAREANGLIGTLNGITLNKAGLGYCLNNEVKVTTAEAVNIIGSRGYIDPSKVVPQSGNSDRVIVIKGLMEGIKDLSVDSVDEQVLVNVYTINGLLVKKNVKAAEASKGLQKGLYIIGKKKVAVR